MGGGGWVWSAEGPSSGSNSVASGSSSESESTSGNSSVPLAGSGCGHLHADALSREPPMENQADEPEFEPDVMQVTTDPAVHHDKEMELGTEFVKLQREDQRLQEIRGYLLDETLCG